MHYFLRRSKAVIKCLQLVYALVIVCFRDDPALVDTALVNAASVKNDVYLWIYNIIYDILVYCKVETLRLFCLKTFYMTLKKDVFSCDCYYKLLS
jgi:hypothetical protein